MLTNQILSSVKKPYYLHCFTDNDHAGFQDYSPKSYSFDRNSIYEKHHPLPSNNYSERYVVMV